MAKELKELFSDIVDPRVVNRCDHKLQDILFIALCTLISNGEDFEDMVLFGNEHYDWLKTVLELPNGIPSHDTFNRVLQLIKPDTLSEVLEKDGRMLLDTLEDKQICLDGKKIKGVSPGRRGNKGYYILSAWVSETSLCVGQKKVNDKSNEITAIPELLDNIEVKDSVISIDAIGCQKSIATKIIGKEADYLLALKENQKESLRLVEEAFLFHQPELFDETKEKGHGRIETRKCSIIDINNLPEAEVPSGWENLNTLVKVEATRKIKNKEQKETRYYLSSEKITSPGYYNLMVRGHWSIENHLHWHLDVTFKEDGSRARSGNAPLNLNILRKVALQRINLMQDRLSKKKRRFKASMNIEYLKQVLKI